MSSLGTRTGTVTDFDDARGLGTITDETGIERLFHCTQIADGTRTIEPGTAVRFTVIAGRAGTWEAGAIERE